MKKQSKAHATARTIVDSVKTKREALQMIYDEHVALHSYAVSSFDTEVSVCISNWLAEKFDISAKEYNEQIDAASKYAEKLMN